VCCDDKGVAGFAKLRQRRNDRHVLLRAFDLLELDGKNLRALRNRSPGREWA
jgi:ATP-dependent DNA ligase